MTDRPFVNGDKIVIAPEHAPADLYGVVFEVQVVNPKNIKASRVGGGRGINYPKGLLQHFEGEVDPAANVPVAKPYVPIEFFDIGELVAIKVANKELTTETPLVVIRDNGSDKVNVTKVGGSDNLYWRIPRGNIVKRDLEWLKSVL